MDLQAGVHESAPSRWSKLECRTYLRKEGARGPMHTAPRDTWCLSVKDPTGKSRCFH